MMAPQWIRRIPDATLRAQAERVLDTAWYRTPDTKLFAWETVGDTINFNIHQKNLRPLDLDAPCVFPAAGGRRFTLRDLCVTGDATPKEGCHDRVGVAMFRGPGIRKGVRFGECSNLDLAPTLLHLMGVAAPEQMRGRVLEEVLEAPTSVAVPALAR
jgi:hypothetical protein